jgi:hypothetical protein
LVDGTGTSPDNPPVFNIDQVITAVSVVEFRFSGVRNATGTFTPTTSTTNGSTTSG